MQKLGDHGQNFRSKPARLQLQKGGDMEVRRVDGLEDAEEASRPQGIRKGGWDTPITK